MGSTHETIYDRSMGRYYITVSMHETILYNQPMRRCGIDSLDDIKSIHQTIRIDPWNDMESIHETVWDRSMGRYGIDP